MHKGRCILYPYLTPMNYLLELKNQWRPPTVGCVLRQTNMAKCPEGYLPQMGAENKAISWAPQVCLLSTVQSVYTQHCAGQAWHVADNMPGFLLGSWDNARQGTDTDMMATAACAVMARRRPWRAWKHTRKDAVPSVWSYDPQLGTRHALAEELVPIYQIPSWRRGGRIYSSHLWVGRNKIWH